MPEAHRATRVRQIVLAIATSQPLPTSFQCVLTNDANINKQLGKVRNKSFTLHIMQLLFWHVYDVIGLERLQQLFDVLTEDGYVVRTHVYRVSDGNDAYSTLQQIDAQRNVIKHVLLDLPTKECEALFQKEVNPINIVYVYHVGGGGGCRPRRRPSCPLHPVNS